MQIEDYFWYASRKNSSPLLIATVEVKGDLPYKYSLIITDSQGVQLTEHMNLSPEEFEDRAYAVLRELRERSYDFLAVDVLGLSESKLEARVKQRREEERQKRERDKLKPSP